jgi:BTB/POZ domain
LTFHSLLSGENATVVVGEAKVPFTLPKKLLCHELDFFKDAFTGESEGARSGVVELKDVEPDAFRDLLRWFFNKRVPVLALEKHTTSPYTLVDIVVITENDQTAENYSSLIRLYVLAIQLHAEKLASTVIETLTGSIRSHCVEGKTSVPGCDDIIYAYEHSRPGSELRKAVAKKAALRLTIRTPNISQYEAAILQKPEFALDLLSYVGLVAADYINRGTSMQLVNQKHYIENILRDDEAREEKIKLYDASQGRKAATL